MDVLGYTESGAIRVVFDGSESESVVPDDMTNRHRRMIADWEAEGNTIPPYVPTVIPVPIKAPTNYAQNRFEIQNGEVAMVDGSPGFAGGFVLEEGVVYIFFAEEVADSYSVYFDMAEPVFCYVQPEEKDSFGFIVRAVSLAGGTPVTPVCIGIKVER